MTKLKLEGADEGVELSFGGLGVGDDVPLLGAAAGEKPQALCMETVISSPRI